MYKQIARTTETTTETTRYGTFEVKWVRVIEQNATHQFESVYRDGIKVNGGMYPANTPYALERIAQVQG